MNDRSSDASYTVARVGVIFGTLSGLPRRMQLGGMSIL